MPVAVYKAEDTIIKIIRPGITIGQEGEGIWGNTK